MRQRKTLRCGLGWGRLLVFFGVGLGWGIDLIVCGSGGLGSGLALLTPVLERRIIRKRTDIEVAFPISIMSIVSTGKRVRLTPN